MSTSKKAAPAAATQRLIITPPNLQNIRLRIVGAAPYVQHKFSKKVRDKILQDQMEGPTTQSKKKREPRDIEQEYKEAQYLTADGKHGIPASAFRSAMISACRLVGFVMTRAKLSIFVEADDLDYEDGIPLVHIEGEPELLKSPVRLESGVTSIAIRPMWRKWAASVSVNFDRDQFDHVDVTNLLARAGCQVGIGEGRPDSKKSHGMGWGLFSVDSAQVRKQVAA